MTRSQNYLIGALVLLFGAVLFLFRPELFQYANRPGVTALFSNYVVPYGFVVCLLGFGWLLGKGLGVKGWIPVALLILVELVYVVILHFGAGFLPEKAKLSGWLGHFKRVALNNRSMIQFQEDAAQYDPELFYTLKPGLSNFRSFEYNTPYSVNSLGVRDDEKSLDYPEVVFLGDSFTMGWGVEEEQTFASRFEQLSGVKSLNTGVSSYGTARERFIFSRVKLDSLKAIVLQFHDTDLAENAFYLKENRLGSRTVQEFTSQVKDNRKYMKYIPFQYLKTALLNTLVNADDGVEAALTTQGSPEYVAEFYQILSEITAQKDVPVFFTYTGSFYTDPSRVALFERYAEDKGIQGIYFINLGKVLDHEDYFYFDDHFNAKGHEKLAKLLVDRYKEVIK
jgi:hypothetical protein